MPPPTNSDLTPVQWLILKTIRGESLEDERDAIRFYDIDGREHSHSEQSYLQYLFNEGRCNASGLYWTSRPRRIAISMGRRSGKSEIVANLLADATFTNRIIAFTHNNDARLALIRQRNLEFVERRRRQGAPASQIVSIAGPHDFVEGDPRTRQLGMMVFDEAALMSGDQIARITQQLTPPQLPDRTIIMIGTPGLEGSHYHNFYRSADISLTVPTWEALPSEWQRVQHDIRSGRTDRFHEYAAQFQQPRRVAMISDTHVPSERVNRDVINAMIQAVARDPDFQVVAHADYLAPAFDMDIADSVPVHIEEPDPFPPIDCYEVLAADGIL